LETPDSIPEDQQIITCPHCGYRHAYDYWNFPEIRLTEGLENLSCESCGGFLLDDDFNANLQNYQGDLQLSLLRHRSRCYAFFNGQEYTHKNGLYALAIAMQKYFRHEGLKGGKP
jgi:hypothetical protein